MKRYPNIFLREKALNSKKFYYLYKNHPDIINQYFIDFFFLDDDIIFDIIKILKKCLIYLNIIILYICAPTFHNVPECKISHKITISKKTNSLRYVNFIEVNVPLFRMNFVL